MRRLQTTEYFDRSMILFDDNGSGAVAFTQKIPQGKAQRDRRENRDGEDDRRFLFPEPV